MCFTPAPPYHLQPNRQTVTIQLVRQHDGRVAGVIEQSSVRVYHPIYYFLTVNTQRRSRFAMWKRGYHGRRTQQNIPRLEELLPGGNRLVPPIKRFQVLGEGSRWRILF